MTTFTDPIEALAEKISQDYGINIAAERIDDKYLITLSKSGPRRQYAALHPAEAEEFLRGVTAGWLLHDEPEDEAVDESPIPPALLKMLGAALRCPDCNSDVGEPRASKYGIWSVEIQHSDTCPYMKQFQDEEEE